MTGEDLRGEWTSASSALPDRLCRGRYQAQLELPELPPTDERESGVVIHALWTGNKPPREPRAEETESAEALREQEAFVAQEFFGRSENLVRIVERRLWHQFPRTSEAGGRKTLKTSGQFDVALVQPEARRALICDGKSGWLPMSPNVSNLQLRRLAALLWLELSSPEIGVCILKPFARPEPVCVYGVSELERSVFEMEEDVRQSHLPGAPRTAGEEQCRYCKARETCPARLVWLGAVLPPAFPALAMVPARDWTLEQRALFLDREKEARDWLEDRKQELKAMLAEDPRAVPGYGLKPGRMIETITDAQEVFRRFCRNLGGTAEAFTKCVKVGKTALKEEVRALSGRKGRGLDAELEQLLAGCVEVKTGAPTIEREKSP